MAWRLDITFLFCGIVLSVYAVAVAVVLQSSSDVAGSLRYNARGDAVFLAASLGVVFAQSRHSQDFYMYEQSFPQATLSAVSPSLALAGRACCCLGVCVVFDNYASGLDD